MIALGKYLLISPIEQLEEKSASGLLLSATDTSKIRYQEATVVLPGTDVTCKVKKGDKIAFDSGAGHNIKIDGVFYRVILERDIALIL